MTPTTGFADELQNRLKLPKDQTKQNIMLSYLTYREYYDRKAGAVTLKEEGSIISDLIPTQTTQKTSYVRN